MRMRDTFGAFYSDDMFVTLYPQRGQPAYAPWRLALVTLMQFVEGLSDRQTADAVRGRIDWKYALSLPLEDAGFNFSVLSEFRDRLVADANGERLLDTLLTHFREHGLLTLRGRQRTDSTHVFAAIRQGGRLLCVLDALVSALNAVATAAPDWLTTQSQPAWAHRYRHRADEMRLPRDSAERQRLGQQIGEDGTFLLYAVYAETAPPHLRDLAAIEMLRRIWVQQYEQSVTGVVWRAAAELPPNALLLCTAHDPDARFSRKRDTTWTGYKVHLTESCDDATPHLLTHVETTAATTSDAVMPTRIHAALAAKDALPQQHLMDSGYVDTGVVMESRADHQVEVIGPVNADGSWQSKAGLGYDNAHFVIDWSAQTATCPRGQTSVTWLERTDRHGHPTVQINFGAETCRVCPMRTQCTRSKTAPRKLFVRQHDQYLVLQNLRQRQTTEEFKKTYAKRAGIEGTLSQGVRAFELRKARYRGLPKTHLQHVATAAAINVCRVSDWMTETARVQTRTSAFAALTSPASAPVAA